MLYMQVRQQALFAYAMKKALLLISTIITLNNFAFSQNKYDYVWVMGTKIVSSTHRTGGSLINFNSGIADTSSMSILFYLDQTIGSISDNNGNLLFYTNGCEVMTNKHQGMLNGDSLNIPFAGPWQEDNCARDLAYGPHSGLIILSKPNTGDQYVIFHLRYDASPAQHPLYFYNPQSLLFTSVDMSAENGLGRVEQKNVLIKKDTFCDMLSAVRHGNGRDWWVAAPKPGSGDKPSDKILLFHFGPGGVEGPFVKKTALTWKGNPNTYTVGQAVFSPDGSRYARFDTKNGVQLFCFDRCSGEFTCPVQLTFPGDTLSAAGLSFSPNGRFLYASTGKKMYQFDCFEKDIQASKTLLGVYDGFKAPLWTTFYQQRLAPDGKIYMSCTNGAYYLHVVHNPDAKGKDCNFEQHGFELPTQNGFCLPNYPNYRLFDWSGSPCDSLGIDAPRDTVLYFDAAPRFFPNPADKQVTIVAPVCSSGNLRVYNAAGILMQDIPGIVSGQSYTLDVAHWPAAVYFVAATTREHGVATRKLVVAH